jgi:prephenate dehydrogenase
MHDGISAGSYKDMTRVAHLNEKMWTQLFLENSDNLSFELDHLIASLQEFRDAIFSGDAKKLESLLAEGRKLKEKVDGKDG